MFLLTGFQIGSSGPGIVSGMVTGGIDGFVFGFSGAIVGIMTGVAVPSIVVPWKVLLGIVLDTRNKF